MVRKKVLFVNTNIMRPVVAPLAFDYLGQFLIKNGYDIDLLDLALEKSPKKAIQVYFSKNNVLAIGATIRNVDDSYFASQDFFIPRIKKMIDWIKKETDAPIVLGGVGFSSMPESILKYLEVNLGIRGDGEEALLLLLNKIIKGDDYSQIPGLIIVKNDRVISNSIQPVDLQKISLSQRNIINNKRYFEEGGMVGIETKRGCSKNCIYCFDVLAKGRKMRLRPAQDIVNEIKSLLNQGVNYFHLCDSEFNLPSSHALEICQEIIRRNLGDKINWYAYCSPVPFSDNLAKLMKKAGMVGVDFGVDHGNNSMLKTLGRDFNKEDLINTANICHRYKIIFMYDLLMGGPGENKKTVKETIELMKRINPSRVGVSVGIRIFPKTKLSQIVQLEGMNDHNKNLYGIIKENQNFFFPVFYISQKIGLKIVDYISDLVGSDRRFFFPRKENLDQNYNYNENIVLIKAIKKGYRGAFWDILRRVAEGE